MRNSPKLHCAGEYVRPYALCNREPHHRCNSAKRNKSAPKTGPNINIAPESLIKLNYRRGCGRVCYYTLSIVKLRYNCSVCVCVACKQDRMELCTALASSCANPNKWINYDKKSDGRVCASHSVAPVPQQRHGDSKWSLQLCTTFLCWQLH